MEFLQQSDFTPVCDTSTLDVIAQSNNNLLSQAEAYAIEEVSGYCRSRYNIGAEFAKTGEEAQKLAVDHAYPMIHVDSDSLNMRSGPGTDADVLETVLYDTLWEYLGEENGFWHVRYTSYMDGYLSQEFSSYGMYLKEASVQYTSN